MNQLTANTYLVEPKVGTTVERVRPSIIAILTELLPLLMLLVALYYVWVSYIAVQGSSRPYWFDAARILLLLEISRRYFNRCYSIRETTIKKHIGLFSLNYRSSTIKIRDIREIKIQQNLLGRLLGHGDVLIGTASTNGYEIEMHAVPHPSRTAQLIQKRRSQMKQNLSSGD